MVSYVHGRPFDLFDFDSLFESLNNISRTSDIVERAGNFPPMDIVDWEKSTDFIFAVAGYAKNGISVISTDSYIEIKLVDTNKDSLNKDSLIGTHRKRILQGIKKADTSVKLKVKQDSYDRVEASMNDGLLTVTVFKKQAKPIESKIRNIKIN